MIASESVRSENAPGARALNERWSQDGEKREEAQQEQFHDGIATSGRKPGALSPTHRSQAILRRSRVALRQAQGDTAPLRMTQHAPLRMTHL